MGDGEPRGVCFGLQTLRDRSAVHQTYLGRLTPGAKADITVFDLSLPDLGQVIDPIQTMMISGSGRDFTDAIIDGRFVMEDGKVHGVDAAANAARAQAQFGRLIALYPRRTIGHPPVESIFSSSYPVARRAA